MGTNEVVADIRESASFAALVERCPPLAVSGCRDALRVLVSAGHQADWTDPESVIRAMVSHILGERKRAVEEDDVITTIRARGGRITTSQLTLVTGRSRTASRRALRRLERAGVVERTGDGNDTEYRLVPN